MRVQLAKWGDRVRTLEVEEGATIADVLRRAGEDPSDLAGFQIRIFGETGEVRLDRPVEPGETVMLSPEVKGGEVA